MKNFKLKLITIVSFYLNILLAQAFGQVTGPVSVPFDLEDAVAVDIPVLLDPAGIQQEPVAAVGRQGNSMVVWRDSQDGEQSIKAQGFDRFGDRLGPVATVSALESSYRGNPDITANYDGTFVITWEDSTGNTANIYYRTYDIHGMPWDAGPQLATEHGSNPSVAVDSAGNVLLAWQEETDQGTDIIGARFAREIEADGDDQGTTAPVWTGPDTLNYTREWDQEYPEIAADMSGNFAVAWRNRDDSVGVRVRFFLQSGEYISSWVVQDSVIQLEERFVSGAGAKDVSAPSVALVPSKSDSSYFLVCWIDSLDSEKAVKLQQFNVYHGSGEVTVTPETLVSIHSSPLIQLQRPRISANEKGVLVVAWHEMTGERMEVIAKLFSAYDQSSTRTDTLAWKKTDQPGDIINLDVVLRPEGGYVVVREDADNDLKMQNITTEGKGNEQPFQLSFRERVDESGWSAALVAHDDESFTVFWERMTSDTLDVDTLIYKIDTIRVRIDTVISGRVDTTVLEADTTQLAVAEVTDTVQVRWARFDFDGKFLVPPQEVDPENEWKQRQPVAAKGPTGSYVVLWHEQKGDEYRIRAKLFDKEHNLIFADPLIAWQSDYLSNIAVSLDSSDQIYMAWEQWKKEESVPLLKRARFCCAADNNLTNPAINTVSDGGRLAGISASDKGTYMAVWRQGASQGQNASIRGIILDDQDKKIKDEIQISTDEIDYLGGVGRPVVTSSPVNGNYLVVWQEFFAQQEDFRRNRLYCSLFHWQADTAVVRPYRRYFDFGEDSRISPASPAVSVDESGNYLILWVEMNIDGASSLVGMRLDPSGNTVGGKFKVPNVTLGALPMIDITASGVVVVAWQDSVGDRMRVLTQVLNLEFHEANGNVKLAGFENGTKPVFVHISGNVNDSSLVDREGRFHFQSLVPGEYRLWLSVGGERFSASQPGFTLRYGDSPSLELGTIADLSGVKERRFGLPRAFALHPNAPNPFNPSTTIAFEIADRNEPVRVLLAVYDLRGRLVKTLMDTELAGGSYSLVWDGRDNAKRMMPSGVYFLRLRAGAESMVRKMILLK